MRRWSFCTAEREILYFFKNLKDDMSAGLVAAENGEVERKGGHQDLMKASAQEIQVLTKTIEEQQVSQEILVVEMAKMKVHFKA